MGREPWLAVNLSIFWPGLGHWYLGRRREAISLIALQLGLYVVGIGLLLTPAGSVPAGVASLVCAPLVFIASLVHAHRLAVASNSAEFETQRKAVRDPWLAVVLSRILPGLGHAYLGKLVPAAAFLAGFLLLSIFSDLRGLSEVLNAVWFGLASYHAYRLAPARREVDRRWIRRVAGAVVAVWILGGVSILAAREFAVQAFRTPTSSMQPTLQAGDFFFVRKWNRDRIRRGDVVAFRFPLDPSKDFVDRVIGLPGERIEIRDGQVRVNGRGLDEPYVMHPRLECGPSGVETAEFGPQVVPRGEVFVMGDHRDRANDSRYWGTLRIDHVKGIAYKIYWPLSRSGPLSSHPGMVGSTGPSASMICGADGE